ncbi:MAG TPA: chemotaxis protein CheD [Tepidisphaeraceae bacterium]|nr:chemotaxis protein CheD [Tepidisphaeraceae bacterium]
MNIVVNISDAKVADTAGAVLATYSLGSCIGVALYDPVAKVGGMLHFQLPTSTLDADRARQLPMMFADTGMKHLMDQMAARGAQKARIKTWMAGAAQMLNDSGIFNIGRRNHAAIRKILWQYGLLISGEDIGGSTPRNLYLSIDDGTVTVKIGNTVTKL